MNILNIYTPEKKTPEMLQKKIHHLTFRLFVGKISLKIHQIHKELGATSRVNLEDPHHDGRKWLITMVSLRSPKDRVVGPLPNDPNGL